MVQSEEDVIDNQCDGRIGRILETIPEMRGKRCCCDNIDNITISLISGIVSKIRPILPLIVNNVIHLLTGPSKIRPCITWARERFRVRSPFMAKEQRRVTERRSLSLDWADFGDALRNRCVAVLQLKLPTMSPCLCFGVN